MDTALTPQEPPPLDRVCPSCLPGDLGLVCVWGGVPLPSRVSQGQCCQDWQDLGSRLCLLWGGGGRMDTNGLRTYRVPLPVRLVPHPHATPPPPPLPGPRTFHSFRAPCGWRSPVGGAGRTGLEGTELPGSPGAAGMWPGDDLLRQVPRQEKRALHVRLGWKEPPCSGHCPVIGELLGLCPQGLGKD